MSIPAVQKVRIGTYIIRQLLAGKRRFPLVLMLEPLFRCNLRCKGCGKIKYPAEVLNRYLSVEECLDASEECGAPVVSIPGGEPLLHPDIHLIVNALIARKRFVYLCTNGLLVSEKINLFSPSPYLSFNIHIDGLREEHDAAVCRQGVFDKAVNAIRLLVKRGFRVTTNTTFFKNATPLNAALLFDFLTSLKVEAMTVSSGFGYETAADQDYFLGRQGTYDLFQNILEMNKTAKWEFNHSSLYLDFLAGRQNYVCTPWGNPTRNIFGWQQPCYLLSDGYAATYRELTDETEWRRYGLGKDPRCADCMVHSGFEPTAVTDAVKNPLKSMITRYKIYRKQV